MKNEIKLLIISAPALYFTFGMLLTLILDYRTKPYEFKKIRGRIIFSFIIMELITFSLLLIINIIPFYLDWKLLLALAVSLLAVFIYRLIVKARLGIVNLAMIPVLLSILFFDNIKEIFPLMTNENIEHWLEIVYNSSVTFLSAIMIGIVIAWYTPLVIEETRKEIKSEGEARKTITLSAGVFRNLILLIYYLFGIGIVSFIVLFKIYN